MLWTSASTGDGPKPGMPFGAFEPGKDASSERRVLVVEDEWLISTEILSILEGGRWRTVGVAVSADEAVAMAERLRPHLILMDLRLSGPRDGIDAALEIRKRLGLRCLFVTAHVDPETRARAETAEPLGWLSKPFSPVQLRQALERALPLH